MTHIHEESACPGEGAAAMAPSEHLPSLARMLAAATALGVVTGLGASAVAAAVVLISG